MIDDERVVAMENTEYIAKIPTPALSRCRSTVTPSRGIWSGVTVGTATPTGTALYGTCREDEPGSAAHDGHGVGFLPGRHDHPYGITRVPTAS